MGSNYILHPELINTYFFSSKIWIDIFAIFLINLLISLFYNVFQLRWPEYYFSTSDQSALYLSVSGKRFFLFRFLPVFLITTILLGVFAKTSNLSESILIGVLAMLVYALRTNGLSLFYLVIKSPKVKTYYNLPFQLTQHFFVISMLLLIGFISGWFSKLSFILNITPSISGLVDNVWASALAVLLGTYLRDLYAARSLPTLDDVFRKSLKNIDPKILEEIDQLSTQFNANPNLAKAICIVENIQRPKWFRRIENLKSVFKIKGTYGIMQVSARKLLSDKESVEIAIKDKLANTKDLELTELVEVIQRYNPDSNYKDQVIQAISYLGYSR